LLISFSGLDMLKIGSYFPKHELFEMTNSLTFIEAFCCVWSGKENPSTIFGMDFIWYYSSVVSNYTGIHLTHEISTENNPFLEGNN